MIIGCDVDGVIVDTPMLWLEHLESICNKTLPRDQMYNYDLRVYFEKELENIGIDAFEWWRQEGLYDYLEPIEGSVGVLQELSERGHEIVFVSAIKGWHVKSKYYFLRKYFPFMSGYVSTKEKGYVRADVMIDDRARNLQLFSHDTLKLMYDSKFLQNDLLDKNRDCMIHIAKDWQSVYDIIRRDNG